jgi:hypothetical protein
MKDSEGDQEGVFHLSHPVLGQRTPQGMGFQEGLVNT